MKNENNPKINKPIEFEGKVYSQKTLDAMSLKDVWGLVKDIGKKSSSANHKWMYQLKGIESLEFRDTAKNGICKTARKITDYYWARPEHDDTYTSHNDGYSKGSSIKDIPNITPS